MTVDSCGIPPSVRGLHHHRIQFDHLFWNTPACTGTAGTAAGWGWRWTEYPRLYGDCMAIDLVTYDTPGIPPSVRGL